MGCAFAGRREREAHSKTRGDTPECLPRLLPRAQAEAPKQRIVAGKKEKGWAVAYNMSDIPDHLLLAVRGGAGSKVPLSSARQAQLPDHEK